jgi:hypothetical protein
MDDVSLQLGSIRPACKHFGISIHLKSARRVTRLI